MNFGVLIVLATILGYVANWINWRFLNYRLVRLLYFVGAFVHETSHAILCVLTGARILEFKIFSRQPSVTYSKPRLRLIGEPLISLAPIIGGLLFFYLINEYLIAGYFQVPAVASPKDALMSPFALLGQINLIHWQSWLMILLFLNAGAMIGPSVRDLKNIWPILIIFFLISSTIFDNLLFLVFGLILTNILIQIILISFIWLFRRLKKPSLAR